MEIGLVVVVDPGEEATDVVPWTLRLLDELSTRDDLVVEAVTDPAPERSKAVGGVIGALVAKVSDPTAFRRLVQVVRDWATRTDRTVEITLDGDVLKLTRASSEQQQLLVETFVGRHSRT